MPISAYSNPRVSKETFRQIFIDHWSGFKEKYPIYGNDQYDEVVEKMLGCGKEEGGYVEYICMNCGQGRRRICFTCKSSFCLSCAKVYVDDFVKQISNVLRQGVRYRHIILTIPKQLRKYFYRNRHSKILFSAFMRCGYECLENAICQIKRHDLKIGTIIVIQTHGRSGEFNPHLHIIMTSGGINEQSSKWEDLNYIPYDIIHKKWQYFLFGMMKKEIPTQEMKRLVDDLWKKYPKGLVANVGKGEVPARCKGLAKYLAKYLASPPISVRRIIKYDGNEVTYWYNDHKSKKKKVETVSVYTFIGRMVQHIFSKGFQRVRYFGLQATKTFSKWSDAIKEGLKRTGRLVKGVYQVLSPKGYRERYMEVSGRDPMICNCCGSEMDIYKIWHPKYGVVFDALANMKDVEYEKVKVNERKGRHPVRPATQILQLPLFPLPV